MATAAGENKLFSKPFMTGIWMMQVAFSSGRVWPLETGLAPIQA